MRICALDEQARAAGLHKGQTLSDARALIPGLECFDLDPAGDGRLLAGIAGWCDRYTPLVAIDGSDGLFLDISGCTHLFGGEGALVEDIVTRLRAQGFSVRAAIADTPGAAWAMARYGTHDIVPAEKTRDMIGPLPLAGLRLEAQTVTDLNRMGLKTIDCVADVARAPLATRFGSEVLRRLDQALGREDEAISPLTPVPELSAERRFADPIALQDDIEHTIRQLASHLKPSFEQRGVGARRLEMRLFRVDGQVQSLAVRASTPLRDADRILGLFRERISALHDGLDAGFGFDLVRLNILECDACDSRQIDLIDGAGPEDETHALIDRLGARLGTDRVRQFARADTHIPERSFGTVPASLAPPGKQDETGFELGPAGSQTVPLIRPVFFLNRPEPVEAIAGVPEGPPIRFRWRKALYEVARSEGPERIACEWWRDGRNALSRDYFRVEDQVGYRFWLFRHGLYERETATPQWYMHGLFP